MDSYGTKTLKISWVYENIFESTTPRRKKKIHSFSCALVLNLDVTGINSTTSYDSPFVASSGSSGNRRPHINRATSNIRALNRPLFINS